MSEAKRKEELQEDAEAVDENTSVSEPLDEAGQQQEPAEDKGEQDLEAQLAEAQATIEDLRDKMLRAAAENENFKKRVERDRMASLKYAGEAIFKEMLPVVDNLERAIDQGIIADADAEQNLAGLLQGIELTLKSLVTSLEKFEVKPIDSVGKPFDPQHQEALSMGESDTIPANHVITEFEKGYYYKDRLLRAAKVIVSSGKKEQAS